MVYVLHAGGVGGTTQIQKGYVYSSLSYRNEGKKYGEGDVENLRMSKVKITDGTVGAEKAAEERRTNI